jgi:hypothetical protein
MNKGVLSREVEIDSYSRLLEDDALIRALRVCARDSGPIGRRHGRTDE